MKAPLQIFPCAGTYQARNRARVLNLLYLRKSFVCVKWFYGGTSTVPFISKKLRTLFLRPQSFKLCFTKSFISSIFRIFSRPSHFVAALRLLFQYSQIEFFYSLDCSYYFFVFIYWHPFILHIIITNNGNVAGSSTSLIAFLFFFVFFFAFLYALFYSLYA